MELRNGPVSVFRLFLYSAKTANQAFGTVLFSAVLLVLFVLLLLAIAFGISMLNSSLGLAVFQLPFGIINAFLQCLFLTSVIQILASRFEKTGIGAAESLRDSLIPTVYFIISSLIMGMGATLVLWAAVLSRSSAVILITALVLALACLPFCFTLQAAVLRNEGPVGALRYSWELGSRHYGRIFLTGLALALFFIVLFLAAFCLAKALLPPHYAALFTPQGYAMLPLILGMSLVQLSALHKILLAAVCVFLYLYAYLFVQGVWTGLFLNLDYTDRAAETRELEALAQSNAVAEEEARRPAGALPDVGIKKASVKTDADEADTARHLDQVYSAQEHLARALEQEEDRMPTILFDEEMAKQLAENEEKMRQSKEASAKRKEDDGQQSIKMSDKPL